MENVILVDEYLLETLKNTHWLTERQIAIYNDVNEAIKAHYKLNKSVGSLRYIIEVNYEGAE